MTSQLLYLTILTLVLSFNSSSQENKTELNVTGSNKTNEKVKENLRFDITAGRINTFQETIEIKASLFNDNIDTVYFLSTTCDGEQYSLRYDTAKFVLTPILNCNTINPIIIKIAPKGQYDFQAHFRCIRCSSNETKIKLGFDFYPVDKSFCLTNKKLGDLNIFNRPEDQQIIIWADEKIIKQNRVDFSIQN